MAPTTFCLALLFWTSLLTYSWCSTLSKAELKELEKVSTWVISRSFPCSATCGLGLRTQELCPNSGTRNISRTSCRTRTVSCLDTWQCGLKTQTTAVGQRLELDCLEEVMEAMGRFAFMVSWRFAGGIITSDDSLFTRYKTLSLDKVVLDPVREEDAGTYRCDVLDTGKRRVKRMYKGVKVLSSKEVSLDFDKGLNDWEKPAFPNATARENTYPSSTVRYMALISLSIAFVMAVLIFMFLYVFYWRRREAQPIQDDI